MERQRMFVQLHNEQRPLSLRWELYLSGVLAVSPQASHAIFSSPPTIHLLSDYDHQPQVPSSSTRFFAAKIVLLQTPSTLSSPPRPLRRPFSYKPARNFTRAFLPHRKPVSKMTAAAACDAAFWRILFLLPAVPELAGARIKVLPDTPIVRQMFRTPADAPVTLHLLIHLPPPSPEPSFYNGGPFAVTPDITDVLLAWKAAIDSESVQNPTVPTARLSALASLLRRSADGLTYDGVSVEFLVEEDLTRTLSLIGGMETAEMIATFPAEDPYLDVMDLLILGIQMTGRTTPANQHLGPGRVVDQLGLWVQGGNHNTVIPLTPAHYVAGGSCIICTAAGNRRPRRDGTPP
ncbi:hypothetical protein BDW74DRAFT_179085 [Aspergillus multicolor]|uniref:uncharacterized protein n=1 Tax=Aspergillus multicolor TaxID=41759 RepID=UPI003CCD273D